VRSRPFHAVVTQQRQYSLFKTLYLVGSYEHFAYRGSWFA
jgi:hypothetical protein